MSGTAGSNGASDTAAATAAALRGASLAFGRQKKAKANSRQHLQPQQHLPLPKQQQQQRRQPSVSPSRDSTISNTQAANALLAATSAAASSRDASVSGIGTRSGERAGLSLLRPVSPGQRSMAARSNSSSSRSRSRSRGANASRAVTASSSAGDLVPLPSPGIVPPPHPAIGRTRTGGGNNDIAGGRSLAMPKSTPKPLRQPRSTSFLAATRAASQAVSPGITPNHTGQQGGRGSSVGTISATNTGGPGPVPAHLSAALLAAAASEEKRRTAAATAAANLAANASRVNDDMARYGIRIGQREHEEWAEADDEEGLDSSTIAATSALVSMFEKGSSRGKEKKEPRRVKADDLSSGGSSPVRPPKLKSFTPPRSVSPVRREEALLAETPAKTPTKTPTLARNPATPRTMEPTKPSPRRPAKPLTKAISAKTTTTKTTNKDPVEQKELLNSEAKLLPMPGPSPKADASLQPQQTKPIPITKPKPRQNAGQETSSPLGKVERLETASPGTSPLRKHRLPLRELNDDDDVMGRPSPPNPSVRDSSAARSRSLTKARESPARSSSFSGRGPPPQAPPRRAATALVAQHSAGSATPLRKPAATASSVDGLASAIMAGSLAAAKHPPSSQQSVSSSMPGSRSRTPPAPPSVRSTSPTKRTGMLQTLRRERSHSDDDDYDRDGKTSGNTHYRRSHYHRDGRLRQGKHHLSHATPAVLVGGSRHKHKHHEGSRRRWREAVTERQRRRYEAVWASNRGNRGLVGMENNNNSSSTNVNDGGTIVDDAADDDETVPNVVVRDLWRRSRLPLDELAEVWDLVDETGTGRLGKAGFVVGLWLIDQRLRGRKIPARVSESVWSSARGMQGPTMQRRR
ncbi:hypothetical protein HMPREF1624_02462 [Sporothrix schenckii ATCC 58251]|uniref:EH domain-containing protein n=1 Tax=Sporothrix schenckii (strain ATCC 58251 / de Perez 2211183) TaxID=1391915 RepID=U7Q2H6_SPOS1|nr:hypothetical protein HMPREF1624_02462 [Sporothrix schenckii ATCC 58251]